MVRRLLCPVDFSAPSRGALQHAGRLARQTGARLTVLYVNDPLLEAAAQSFDARAVSTSTLKQLQRFTDRALAGAQAKPRSPVTCQVAVGDPAREIRKAARRLKSDLIVMGTHGLTGLAKVMFGSTTEKFLQVARVPVMLIPRSRR